MICVYLRDLGPILFPHFFTAWGPSIRHMDMPMNWIVGSSAQRFARRQGWLFLAETMLDAALLPCSRSTLIALYAPTDVMRTSRFSGFSIRSRRANQLRSRLCFSPNLVLPPDDRPWFDGGAPSAPQQASPKRDENGQPRWRASSIRVFDKWKTLSSLCRTLFGYVRVRWVPTFGYLL